MRHRNESYVEKTARGTVPPASSLRQTLTIAKIGLFIRSPKCKKSEKSPEELFFLLRIVSGQKRSTPGRLAMRNVAATVRMAYNSGKAARINVLPITSWPLPMAAMPLAQTFA